VLNGMTPMTVTDPTGRFVFREVPEGRVLIEVMALGYQVYETSRELEGDTNVVLDLTPTPQPAPVGGVSQLQHR